eukprot:g41666.t1
MQREATRPPRSVPSLCSALCTSIPHDDGITATASVLNTNNCQFPEAILQPIRFILDHNIFTFDNQFFIQTHRAAMGTKFTLQDANIFRHKFEQDFFATLYHKPMDNLMMLQFSSFHLKRIKEAILLDKLCAYTGS